MKGVKSIKQKMNNYTYKEARKEFTFRDFKNLDYPEELPLEYILIDLMYKGDIDVNFILSTYSKAIEKDRKLQESRYHEACTSMFPFIIDKRRKKKFSEQELSDINRAIHILDISNSFNIDNYKELFGYTDADEKEWDNFCITLWGSNLKK